MKYKEKIKRIKRETVKPILRDMIDSEKLNFHYDEKRKIREIYQT